MTNVCRYAIVSLLLVAPACELPLPADPNAEADVWTPPPSVDSILEDEDCARFTAADFECGGSPVGTWEIILSCPGARDWDPLEGTCPDLIADGDGTSAGVLRVGIDGTYDLRLDERDLELVFNFPLACYGGATEPCNGAHFSGTCDVLDGELCECEVDVVREPLVESGEWFRYGPNMALRSEDGGTDTTFCRVDEHVMRWVRFAPVGDELDWAFVLRRIGDGTDSELGANPE